MAQTNFPKEKFSAVAIANNEIATGAGRVLMRVTRWSSVDETNRLVNTLVNDGPDALLKELQKAKSVGTIRTPDSLAYDLRYASQRPGEDGGRDIVLATDRPIGFWEAWRRPRITDYPFTVIQMHLDKDGRGKGTLSYATKITATKKVIELENFGTSPIALTEVNAEPDLD